MNSSDRGNWTTEVLSFIAQYENEVASAVKSGVDIADVRQHQYNSTSKWDFWGSVFFCATVITTIGESPGELGDLCS